jgi:hypothetical protein
MQKRILHQIESFDSQAVMGTLLFNDHDLKVTKRSTTSRKEKTIQYNHHGIYNKCFIATNGILFMSELNLKYISLKMTTVDIRLNVIMATNIGN